MFLTFYRYLVDNHKTRAYSNVFADGYIDDLWVGFLGRNVPKLGFLDEIPLTFDFSTSKVQFYKKLPVTRFPPFIRMQKQ